MYTEQLSQQLAFMGQVIPATAATGSSMVTEAIPLGNQRRTLFTLQMGGFATSGAAQILVQGATASGATFTTITSLTSPFLTASGAVQSEATEENIVALNLGYQWLKGVVSVTGANVSGIALSVYGGNFRWGPGSQYNRSYVLSPTIF